MISRKGQTAIIFIGDGLMEHIGECIGSGNLESIHPIYSFKIGKTIDFFGEEIKFIYTGKIVKRFVANVDDWIK
jgi:hypothetical protein